MSRHESRRPAGGDGASGTSPVICGQHRRCPCKPVRLEALTLWRCRAQSRPTPPFAQSCGTSLAVPSPAPDRSRHILKPIATGADDFTAAQSAWQAPRPTLWRLSWRSPARRRGLQDAPWRVFGSRRTPTGGHPRRRLAARGDSPPSAHRRRLRCRFPYASRWTLRRRQLQAATSRGS